ncbi:hypothetical protein [Streptomyces sp. EN16]|uniref:hypothetical protein n=1 Tax=Streptomyces sp. EN16 TaxID=212773 RepID=UPI00085195EA|nr:hypothetical protein [Streptomyces sp. EN16]
MTRISITPRFVLDYTVGLYGGQVEVVTKDIGATIGTEIRDENGMRICAYRPGTGHPSTAEEIAGYHLREALENVVANYGDAQQPLSREVAAQLRDVVAGEQKWDPAAEEGTWL